ncbi:hypothetical protein D3C71_1649450 [compost metagenome]
MGQVFLAVRFGDGFILGGFNDLIGARVGLVDDLVGLAACILQCFVDLFLRLDQILLAAVGSGEAVSDLLLALFDGIHQRRPDLGRDDPDQTGERQCLGNEGKTDFHGVRSIWGDGVVAPPAAAQPFLHPRSGARGA